MNCKFLSGESVNQGVEKNTAKAIEWYQKSAAQGNSEARERLTKLKM
jgi:TPR repeat protein